MYLKNQPEFNELEYNEYRKALSKYENMLNNAIKDTRRRISILEYECLYSSCPKATQKYCHLLQRNGMLDNINSDNHLMQLVIKDNYDWQEDSSAAVVPIGFKKIGIRKAFSSKLFCNDHDQNIFKSIEKCILEPYSYNAQVLLMLRPMLKYTTPRNKKGPL